MTTSDRRFAETPEIAHYQSLRDPDESLVVFDGETYRHQDDLDRTPLESFREEDYREESRLRHHACELGQFPWDHWHAWALEDGVPEDLAALGRHLIREADQHGWERDLQEECGWADSGAAMILLALNQPDQARQRWEYLMDTAGERA